MNRTDVEPDDTGAAAHGTYTAAAAAHAAAQDPADIIVNRETRVAALKAALAEMTGVQQQVLVRHESLGLPLGQVARSLGITDAAAAAHLAQARAVITARATP